MLFLLICMYVTLPLFELFADLNLEEKPFPYKMKFPYDANNGIKYPLTYILTSLAGFGVVTTLFSEDSLICYFITYACGQFKLIHFKIDEIMVTGQKNTIQKKNKHFIDGDGDGEKEVQKEYCKLLMEVIRHQNVIIR